MMLSPHVVLTWMEPSRWEPGSSLRTHTTIYPPLGVFCGLQDNPYSILFPECFQDATQKKHGMGFASKFSPVSSFPSPSSLKQYWGQYRPSFWGGKMIAGPRLQRCRICRWLPCCTGGMGKWMVLGSTSGWWFGTCFIFPYIGNDHPNWLIFFRGVQTTNQCFFSVERTRWGIPTIHRKQLHEVVADPIFGTTLEEVHLPMVHPGFRILGDLLKGSLNGPDKSSIRNVPPIVASWQPQQWVSHPEDPHGFPGFFPGHNTFNPFTATCAGRLQWINSNRWIDKYIDQSKMVFQQVW